MHMCMQGLLWWMVHSLIASRCLGVQVTVCLHAMLLVIKSSSVTLWPSQFDCSWMLLCAKLHLLQPALTSVSLDPRKGTCLATLSSARMHSFRASRLLLISAPSSLVCLSLSYVSAEQKVLWMTMWMQREEMSRQKRCDRKTEYKCRVCDVGRSTRWLGTDLSLWRRTTALPLVHLLVTREAAHPSMTLSYLFHTLGTMYQQIQQASFASWCHQCPRIELASKRALIAVFVGKVQQTSRALV